MAVYIKIRDNLYKLDVPLGGYDVSNMAIFDIHSIIDTDDTLILKQCKLINVLVKHNLVSVNQKLVLCNRCVASILRHKDYLRQYINRLFRLEPTLEILLESFVQLANMYNAGWISMGCIEPILSNEVILYQYDDDFIRTRRQLIYNKVLDKGRTDIPLITDKFVLYLGKLYVKMFIPSLTEKIRFKITKKCTKTAGKHKVKISNFNEIYHEIELASTVITNSFVDNDGIVIINGIEVNSPLSAAQLVIEHELVHVLVASLNRKVKHGEFFKKVAFAYFGHTDIKHGLFSKSNNAKINIGDVVIFEADDKILSGVIDKVKRKTVKVHLLSDENLTYNVDIDNIKVVS